jgi:hypothetical protein
MRKVVAMKPTTLLRSLALGAVLLLAACASTYTLDNTVQSFSQLGALSAPATYRFERLPSQQDPAHAQLEGMADTALHAVGLKRDDAAPRYSVQIAARTAETLSPWADPWDRFGWGFGGGWGWRRHAGVGFGMHYESPWYHREVNVLVRELATNKVVYESRAISDGPYFDAAKVFPAMFQAALQGFPNPPQGPRQVNIPIPG